MFLAIDEFGTANTMKELSPELKQAADDGYYDIYDISKSGTLMRYMGSMEGEGKWVEVEEMNQEIFNVEE